MSKQSENEKYYHDKVAELESGVCWANATPAGQLRQDLRAKLAIEYILSGNGKRVLEIGCGNGEFSERFINVSFEMFCIDISPKLIEMLKTKYIGTNLKFEVSDVEQLHYPDGYFDAVVGNGILHHLNTDICLKEIYRVLKKGGRIFFSEPNMLNPEVFLETNIRWIGKLAKKTENEKAFIKWNLKERLKNAGFYNISIIPFDFLQPLTPSFLIGYVAKIGEILEKTPIIKEIAGSLKIKGEK